MKYFIFIFWFHGYSVKQISIVLEKDQETAEEIVKERYQGTDYDECLFLRELTDAKIQEFEIPK